MSNCSASSATVRSPLIAARATFALKAGVWFRRGRLLIVSPDSRGNLARRQAENSTYRPVQILEASSATVNLTPPISGSTAGIVVFGDRRIPVGTAFKFNGG